VVASGTLNDPYTGQVIYFVRGSGTSSEVQIDHVVSLSNAWDTGAEQLSDADREALANDPLNLLAVDGPTNISKGDSDASEWLPPVVSFQCPLVARQIAVKRKYGLWVTPNERDSMVATLTRCPGQRLPG
jgi:hypothetical protein